MFKEELAWVQMSLVDMQHALSDVDRLQDCMSQAGRGYVLALLQFYRLGLIKL